MLSACIIVRDEAPYLGRLLVSLDGCPEIVVLDTGSTDGTLEVVAGFPGVILEQAPWTGHFSQARNLAASFARHVWVLWLDADMVLPPGELAKILACLPRVPAKVDGIALGILDGLDPHGAWTSPRIYRRGLRFHGAVYETLSLKLVLQSPFLIHVQRTETKAARRDKEARYEQMLLAEAEAAPDDLHALMHLRDLAFARMDFPRATAYIDRMLRLGDDYLSHYYLAVMLYQDRQFAPALEQGFRALRACVLDPRVYVLIADAFDELGRKTDALVFYDHALHLPGETRLLSTRNGPQGDDYAVIPLVNKAKVLADLGLKDKAVACYDEALATHPTTSRRTTIEWYRAALAGGRTSA